MGEILKRYRLKSRLFQKDLVTKANVTFYTISK